MRRRTNLTAFALAAGLIGAFAAVPDPIPWHQQGAARWMPLQVPSSGKIGFTSLPATTTDVHFTNQLDDWQGAANRVLENGSGVAVGDVDRDGRPDLFFCSLRGQNALYRNLGNWAFEEITAKAGLAFTNAVSRGAVFADVNSDGWPDLLVSTLAQGVLYLRNDGQGRFVNETAASGLATNSGAMTLALADVDGNGTLDLYVTNYRSEDIRDRARIDVERVNGQVRLAPALRDRLMLTKDGVLEFGEPDMLYLNDGKGHFRPVSWTGGQFLDEDGRPLSRQPADWGLTATFRDLNGDGLPDLYVCNDYWTPDRIWINQGGGRFQAIGRLAMRHTSENSMGVDVADIDRDGQPDLLVLDMLSRQPRLRKRQVLAQTRVEAGPGEIANRPQLMRNALFHNRGDGTFEEIADFAGMPGSDWSWQPIFVDVDLDGYEDVLIAAGHRRDVQDVDATGRIRSLQHPWPNTLDRTAHQQAFTREMMEHARLYPTLEMPIVAFRNTGELTFAETTSDWGTDAPGVHQGLALTDLDGDGDLDFVVNNLNGVCGLYRNNSPAPRVAVQLEGLGANRPGIGARVTLRGGAVSAQTQELACGGHYLSGSQPLLVFAAGKGEQPMSLEVAWRSGRRTTVEKVQANRLYAIPEEDDSTAPRPSPASDAPGRLAQTSASLFLDVSERINHSHVENLFDDFGRQPLLPRKLSQLGPGVAWIDLDGNNTEDLVLGTGRGGHLAIYYGDGHGAFRPATTMPAIPRDLTGLVAAYDARGLPVVVAGSANYEESLPAGPSAVTFDSRGQPLPDSFPANPASTGPLALADFDGDGDLDLFVGGRVVPKRYPEPVSSRLFRRNGDRWQLDAESSRALDQIGLVSGAVWSDLDGDGFPELVLACEWGPVRVFKKKEERLQDITAECGLAADIGWWNGVNTGDFDGDGRLDIVASNWGLNSCYQASADRPRRVFFGDLMKRGIVDLVETEFDPNRNGLGFLHRLDYMAAGLPALRELFATSQQYSEALVEPVLAKFGPPPSQLQATTLASMLFLNRGGRFEARPLPREAQFAPAFAVNVADFDGDGREDVFLSQNFFAVPWQLPRQDAGRGLLLLGDGRGGFRSVPGQESGIKVYGEQRGAAAADFDGDGRVDLAVSQNGSATRLFRNQNGRPGLRIRLVSAQGNPDGVGSLIRLQFGERPGPVREVHAGSGYWSQDGLVQVIAAPEPATAVVVRWPGGRLTTNEVANGSREVIVVDPDR